MKSTGSLNSKRLNSFTYSFAVRETTVRVCKVFYLSILRCSQKDVYNVHNKKNDTGIPAADRRGLHSKRKTSPEVKKQICDHIRSFPVVDSHYCWARTSKKYLEQGLNIQKMYDLYLHQTPKPPFVKDFIYRRIFKSEFGYSFHIPKSDRCDLCEEVKVISANTKKTISEDLENVFTELIVHKVAMRDERARDRADTNKLVVCFDLENVISCPRANISKLASFISEN